MCEGLDLQVKDEDGVVVLWVDLEKFQKECGVEEFCEALEEKPKVTLLCMSIAVHKVLLSHWESNRMDDDFRVNIWLHNHPKSMIALKNLKAAYIGIWFCVFLCILFRV